METNDDLLTIRVKERFDRDFLPKYGALWRQMVKAKKPRQVRQPTVNDFAEAIHKKTSVCMTFPTSQNQKCSCGCAPPIVEAECHVSNARNSDGRNTNDGAGPNSLVIDLIESSDSENEFELHIANTKGFYDNDNAIDLMSLSDDESCDFDSPKKAANFRSSRLRTKRAVSYEVSSESSDENSSESVFDEEEDAMNDLIKTTQSIRIQEDKENNQSSRKEIRSQPTIKRSKIPMSKKQFKKRRQALTHDLFSEFNKKAFGGKLESVQLLWSTKLRTTAGLTRLKKSVQNMRPGIPQSRHATIELSTKVLDCQERLEATLLHEMVHAAAWIIDSVSNPPHGAAFWKWAKVAMRKVPGIVVTTTHSYEIEYKYAWVSRWWLVVFKVSPRLPRDTNLIFVT